MLEKMFKLKENNTSFRTEVVAGLTTFMAMAYILAVNPNILSATGMNPDAILLATALASFVGCMAMALLANYPFALAPGMGLNAYMAFTVCGNMGYSWQIALLAVFVEGLIFVLYSSWLIPPVVLRKDSSISYFLPRNLVKKFMTYTILFIICNKTW